MADEQDHSYLSRRNQSATIPLHHVRYAVVSAEYGSFRRAAEALLTQQSTLSRCIRELEESIGVIVFERSSGGVCATSAGRDFLRTARSILEQMDALVTSAKSNGRGEAGRLSVGFYTSLSAGNLRATLVDFRQRCPQIALGMVERSRMRLVTALRNGAIDVVIATADRPKIERHDVSRGIIKTLISIGFGVSLVAESDIGVTFAGLTYREVRDGTGPSQVSYSAHWRKDNDNPALANFLKLLSERYPLPCAG